MTQTYTVRYGPGYEFETQGLSKYAITGLYSLALLDRDRRRLLRKANWFGIVGRTNLAIEVPHVSHWDIRDMREGTIRSVREAADKKVSAMLQAIRGLTVRYIDIDEDYEKLALPVYANLAGFEPDPRTPTAWAEELAPAYKRYIDNGITVRKHWAYPLTPASNIIEHTLACRDRGVAMAVVFDLNRLEARNRFRHRGRWGRILNWLQPIAYKERMAEDFHQLTGRLHREGIETGIIIGSPFPKGHYPHTADGWLAHCTDTWHWARETASHPFTHLVNQSWDMHPESPLWGTLDPPYAEKNFPGWEAQERVTHMLRSET